MDDPIRKLRLDTIRIVADVLRTRSLTQVAQLRGITQPAVSVHIRKFEEATKLQVVRRVGNEFIPSAHAEHILNACQGILRSAAQLDDYSSLRADRRGRLGIDHELFSLFERREAALSRLLDRYRVLVDGADRLIERFAEAQIDAMVRPLFVREAKPELTFDSPFCWVGAAGVAPLEPDAQAHLPVILPPRATPYGSLARAYLGRIARKHEVVAEIGDRTTLMGLLRAGAGYAFVPEFAAEDYGGSGPPELPEPLREEAVGTFAVFHHKQAFPFAEAEALLADLCDLAQAGNPSDVRLSA